VGKNVYNTLDGLGLPHPEICSIEHILNADSGEKFYLRKSGNTDIPSVISADYVRSNTSKVRHLISKDKIWQIEYFRESIAGGCVVLQQNIVYIELVSGHISSLLSDGLVQIRALCNADDYILKRENQGMEARQGLSGRSQSLSSPIEDHLSINNIIDYIYNKLERVNSSELLEFIVTEDGLFFIDIKKYKWPLEFSEIFDTSNERLLYKNGEPEHIYFGPLCIDEFSPIGSAGGLKINDNACLSHFVTYSLQKNVSLVIV